MVTVFIKQEKYKWKKFTMMDFATWVQGKKIINRVELYHKYDYYWGIQLDDNSVCVATSDWSGPLSEVTPDIDANEPVYMLGILK